MYTLEFSYMAVKDLKKLPKNIQKKLLAKLEFFLASETPLSFSRPLINSEIGQYRFRIGYYRVVFDVLDDKIIVLTLGHRRDIYR